MYKNEIEYEEISRKIKIRYLPTVVAIFVLLILGWTIMQYKMLQNQYYSQRIQIAKNQINLSQMITKDILGLHEFENQEESGYYLDELKTSISAFQQYNIDWNRINEQKPIASDIYESGSLFEDVKECQLTIVDTSYAFIEIVELQNDSKELLLEKVKIIQSKERIYLNGMNQIISHYNMVYRNKIRVIEILENILFVSMLVVIIIQNLYVFRAIDKLLRKACKENCKENENFIKLFRTLSGGLFLVEEKSLQIIHMNEDAERIIESDGKNYQGKAITDLVPWESFENNSIIDKIKTEDKVSNLEVIIREKNDKISSYLLSSVKGNYEENNVILISLFDTTVQKQAEETLRKLAIKDELTGLYNRHFLDAFIVEELERSIRYNYPISVSILDLDYFKRINDNWGHPVGDIILKVTAEMISNNIRKSDFLIRLGGEEFLLIMPHTNIDEAVMVAEKIRKEIEAYTNPIVGKYTVSLGVTQRINTESFHTIYERVDAAMYRAKNEGRNRVVSFKSQADMPIASVYLEWKMQWCSGNKEVDEQHMELLNFANSLMYLSLSNKDKEKAKQLVELLEQKIVYHFEYEEEVLRQIAFPDYQNHLQVHQNLINKFVNIKNSFQKGEVKPSLFFMFIVDEVIVEHLIEMDIKFFPYLNGEIIDPNIIKK